MAVHVFECIDGHTCGNPVRVIAKGAPLLLGASMAEKRLHFLTHYDWIRKGLMFEPRGHDMMSGSMIYPPTNPENDAGILFIETSGCLPMCGHGTIGTVTIAIEHQLIIPKSPGTVRLETPAGLVTAAYGLKGNKVDWVKITNIASFLMEQDLKVDTRRLGPLIFDVAYGGNFYAIIDPQKNYGGLQYLSPSEIVHFSGEIRQKINQTYPDRFIHPLDSRIRDVTHLMWTGDTISPEATARNAVFYGEKAIDRSPCGTGTSARMAQWFAQGKLQAGEPFIHESIIGSRFTGRIEQITKVGEKPAIIPSIEGWARIYGQNTITIDDNDPYAYGFQVL
ncbi:4-hydroxyproline epimerase [Zeaxanthinibacter sp. PT1]|uniref:4-hydroxyproline epimerase n=1 Tax=Zeaxanthinibacter TaxID=561554 RepID=UPI00234A3900|nr:4-hydroxyproline epimerase [Zeaxanthinibacter sp. PT1]MDC6351369.1 4-hydroxyproline epimerase [Zeaxanthinibacter sp. PT1]